MRVSDLHMTCAQLKHARKDSVAAETEIARAQTPPHSAEQNSSSGSSSSATKMQRKGSMVIDDSVLEPGLRVLGYPGQPSTFSCYPASSVSEASTFCLTLGVHVVDEF